MEIESTERHWLTEKGHPEEVQWCERIQEKVKYGRLVQLWARLFYENMRGSWKRKKMRE